MGCQDEIIDHHYRSEFEELKTEVRSYWPSVGVCRWSSSTAADTAASTQTWCLSPNDFNSICIKHINMLSAHGSKVTGQRSDWTLDSSPSSAKTHIHQVERQQHVWPALILMLHTPTWIQYMTERRCTQKYVIGMSRYSKSIFKIKYWFTHTTWEISLDKFKQFKSIINHV